MSNLVYRVRLTGEGVDVTALWPLLTADEQRRADRFLATEPRQQFVACRAALRLILAQLLGVAAGDIRLAQDRWGKPCLGSVRSDRLAVRPSDQATQFNISHSHGLGLIAISPTAVGVDLERRRRLETGSLSRLLLSHLEAADWRRLPAAEQQEQLLRLWVCKEALLKALGLGIADCLQQISLPLPIAADRPFAPRAIDPAIQLHLDEQANCQRHRWTLAEHWTVHPLPVDNHYFAAVVTSPPTAAVELRDFDWSAVSL